VKTIWANGWPVTMSASVSDRQILAHGMTVQ
jgi:hypothetical protein